MRLYNYLSGLAVAALCSQHASAQVVDEDFTQEEPTEDPDTFYSDLHPCPRTCDGKAPQDWDVFSSFDRVKLCDQPMLFDTAIYNAVDDYDTPIKLRICTKGDPKSHGNALVRKREPGTEKCMAGGRSTVKLELSRGGSDRGTSHSDTIAALLGHFSDYFEDQANCHDQILFGYANSTVVGLYAGEAFGKATVKSVVTGILNSISTQGHSSTMTAQICGNGRNSHHTLGVAISTDGDLAAVLTAVRLWDGANCTAAPSTPSLDLNLTAWEVQDHGNATFENNSTTWRDNVYPRGARLAARADCYTVKVSKGDTCKWLASRCGITDARFMEYNPGENLCKNLVPGQRVCCTSGTLTDKEPSANVDGSCTTYLVKPGDNCHKIASDNGITLLALLMYNTGPKSTWGWTGCEGLMAGLNICISPGKPPMPAPVANAVCGPTKPGSEPPRDNQTLADLNPCPLNACCNIWGQCGISGDFCVEERSKTDNPGTSPSRMNGCISNCGMDIISTPAVGFGRVGYYESWNFNRSCLHLRASSANTDGSYTIIHWAFMDIDTSNWTPKIRDDYNQWEQFKGLHGVKRVISFGGWSFSTEPGTYNILRQAMRPENRNVFAKNIAKFLRDHSLDGVDFDWEYPGAMDIEGTPQGSSSDGPNYLKFLTVMNSNLDGGPRGKTISFAAPASFWYLKAFPLKKMAEIVDYIVYMTYDLHVTKAGVASNKIYVGEASYGRSFKMSKEGCTGPMCTFEGDRYSSEAAPGLCTDTPGYISNAEINIIELHTDNVQRWHDGSSNSDMIVYDDTEWVAYMTDVTKDTRRTHWKNHQFAGTIDWAVDLQSFTDDDYDANADGSDFDEFDGPTTHPSSCDASYDTLEAIEKDRDKMEAHCHDEYILHVLQKILKDSLNTHDTLLAHNYNHYFDRYATSVADQAEKSVSGFMFDHGNDYFSCIVTERKHEIRHKNISMPCPPDNSKRSRGKTASGYFDQSTYWTMRDGKETDFYKKLYESTGIDQSHIQWTNFYKGILDTPHERVEYNFPIVKNFGAKDVQNPKDIIDTGRRNLDRLGPDIASALTQIKDRTFGGFTSDLVDAITMPIVLVEQAVASMKTVNDIGEKMDAEKRKAIIIGFISALLFFIPIAGEIMASVATMATIGRIIAMLGAVGSVAMDIYSVVDSKGKDPLSILGLVLAPAAIFDAARVGKAAALRRGAKEADVAKLGKGTKSRLDTIDRIKGRATCRLKKRDELDEVQLFAMPMSSLADQPVMSGIEM
ncbi:hypothetical protein DCS_08170 [Drechmeria coniospora]|uniref:chitinase n=1 Tax=Drechmeria coniospora TaxID=98403 RepID=A0A151GGL0_DRECN|nr:hypothetical protein DCS_08170 [Drechmeria coniospora]KYK56202.1 hypothetical protein DCS_08170 [Drechmeria coniospora]